MTTATPTLSAPAPGPGPGPGAGVERVLGRERGPSAGPTLLVIAGLHGNEPAGVAALGRVFRSLAGRADGLRGEVVGLAGNRKALAAGRRFLVDDLNRAWLPARLARVRASTGPLAAEDEELRELDAEVTRLLAAARGPVFALDLHTTSGPGPAFAVVDDTLSNRELAEHFPVPLVLGLEEELDGPMLHDLLTRGAVTLGFESGQHDESAAVDRAEDAVWIALEACGLLPAGSRPEPYAARQRLAAACRGLPRVTEVRYRHAVAPADGFRMEPGLANFQEIAAGRLLGSDRGGPITAAEGGRILMPLYQVQGDDGFFLIRRVSPFWLTVSARMRRLGLERVVHWLPGVSRHPEVPGAFAVDRRVARWYALEIFHLLGFRRHARSAGKLVVSRRVEPR
jgi:succinylglutamate desuccinylase